MKTAELATWPQVDETNKRPPKGLRLVASVAIATASMSIAGAYIAKHYAAENEIPACAAGIHPEAVVDSPAQALAAIQAYLPVYALQIEREGVMLPTNGQPTHEVRVDSLSGANLTASKILFREGLVKPGADYASYDEQAATKASQPVDAFDLSTDQLSSPKAAFCTAEESGGQTVFLQPAAYQALDAMRLQGIVVPFIEFPSETITL